jgi:hypothetical protein
MNHGKCIPIWSLNPVYQSGLSGVVLNVYFHIWRVFFVGIPLQWLGIMAWLAAVICASHSSVTSAD